MKLRIDRKADALYLRLADSKVIESEQIAPGVILDFDSNDNVVGMEVLDLSRRVRPETGRKRGSCRSRAPAIVRERPARKYGK